MRMTPESSDRLLRLLDFCLEINSEHHLSSLIELLVTRIPKVLGAERGTLLLHDAGRSQLCSRLAEGLAADEEIRIADDSGLAGACFRGNQTINVADAYADPRFNPEVDRDTGFITRSILSLPLRDGSGLATGVLQMMNKPDGFSSEDESFCSLLAAHVGIAVESARSFERLRQEHESTAAENRRLRAELGQRGDLIGGSPAFTRVLERVRQVAPTSTTVLLTGETGTGKELIARRLHELSPRAKRELVAINCSALPLALLESELFGYERGAFTGAVDRKPGLFEVADGGTLFLDEIAEMPIELQAKLLRVLQEGEVRRLGATSGHRVDVRIVAATHRSLRQWVADGRFREDLYYRLNVVPIELPPLRERRDDIPALAAFFLSRFAKRHGKPEPRLSPDALDALVQYRFPGNVRELENCIERAVVLAASTRITPADLPAEVRDEAEGLTQKVPRNNEELKDAKKEAREQAQNAVERRFLVEILRASSGHVTHAAQQTGINRSLLQQMMARHGLNAESFRSK